MAKASAKGFTLIELMIVVVILGFLAVIAMPRFTAARRSAVDGAAQTELRNAMSAQEAYYADNQVYAGDEADLDFDTSTNVTLIVEAGDAAQYVMTAEHIQGRCWEVDSTNGQIVLRGADC